jgi:hypothetical protein
MTATSSPNYDAPAGWTNLTAQAGYTALVGQGVQVVCITGGGAIKWGGAVAPTGLTGIELTAGSSDYETAVSQMWLYGPATYAVTVRA